MTYTRPTNNVIGRRGPGRGWGLLTMYNAVPERQAHAYWEGLKVKQLNACRE